MKVTKAGVLSAMSAVAVMAVAAPAFADTNTSSNADQDARGMRGGMHARMPGVFGKVTAISGTTITITGKAAPQDAADTTYTIDASNATVLKDKGTASSVSAIAMGDSLMVQGTVTGTNVVATMIHSGVPAFGRMGDHDGDEDGKGERGMMHKNPIISGNGQPVIAGSVTALSGTTMTVGTKSNLSYSVDVSAATVVKQGATSTVSDITVGDNVVVQGAVNGTAVVASSVIDQPAKATSSSGEVGTDSRRGGFIGRIGGFFGGFLHMFGF